MGKWAGDIFDAVENAHDNLNFRGFKICTVKSVSPLILTCDEVEIGTKEGDTVYIHPLFITSVIDQDEETLSCTQSFTSTTAYNSPSFEGIIEGSIPDFLKEFYLFYKNWQQTHVLAPGDLAVVYEFGDGVYLVLQKVIQDTYEEEEN